MDFSLAYVKMSTKANEVQKAWKPRDFDFIIDNTIVEDDDRLSEFDRTDLQVVDINYAEPDSQEYQHEYEYYTSRTLWLPRQDQLQELLEPDSSKVYLITDKVVSQQYYYPLKNEYVVAPNLFNSMEQLWLAYVMKEKFGKIWDGNDWVLDQK